uniref:NB-ARC domain-containing protein n=1 Tax=Oryza glumipatula TaxID=40148 RepID=A0A0D9YNU2_9ORYZ
MASDAIVSGVVADMVGRLMSLVAGQLRDRRGDAEEKLRRLRRLVVRIESAVEAAEARRITGRALLAWLSELVDGALQGRYFLDAFPVATDHDGGGRGEAAVANPLNPAKRLRVAARRLVFWDGGTAAELDSVLADLESVSGDLTGFITMLQSCPPALHRPLNTNIYADSQMFGRQVERRRVFDFLLHDSDGDGGGEPAGAELAVLSIVGRQGLGKTTLVQHVCNDLEVRRRFSLIIELDFHCLSLMAAGETALLLRSMFAGTGGAASATITSVFGDSGETLALLERRLRGVRFLAVFDSVDARRRRVIDAIMPTLRRGRRGSKVIVTSRHAEHVAGLAAAAADTITLRPPPQAEYWLFFKAHAFGGADAEADPRLVAAGQAIAKRLRLAASFFGGKMLAALLRSRPDPRFWRTVLSSGAADLPCLGYADDAVAGRLFPPHVTLQSVTMSRSPERGIVSLQDSCLVTPPATQSGDHRRRRRSPELPVLLCKSVFPSYCIYYTAHCTISDSDTDNKQ